ncbi:hypothetical protein ACH4C2_24095 [Streptomyces sp. NPDC018057]|uniref:hypothetical protein n=1 Tax=unclassified Streptomyces TaxID=2593676 RepID=UPI003798BE3A
MHSAKKCLTLALLVSTGLSVGACGADGADDYQGDYSRHKPLHVVGYPSRGSLETVQRTVWRLADRDPKGLAELAVTGGTAADTTARNWVDAFGEAAGGEVTADFYDEGSTRQVVVLYFGGGRKKEVEVRVGEDDTWGVTLDETDPAEAARAPGWAPAAPGGTGSRATAS